MKINLEDLENILYGACFLASGGGGNIGSAQKCIDESGFSNNDYVEVVNYSDIKDNEWIIPTSGMGDPVADFKPSELNNSMFNVIKLMQELYKDEVDGFEKFDYILPMEVGTINSILPILATKIAKDNGVDLKVINADPSGRATPSLPLTLFSGYEQKIVPNFIAGGTKNIDNEEPPYGTFNLKSIDTLQAAFEPLFTSEDFNSCSSFALYAKNKKDLESKFIVEYTMEDALNLGKLIRNKQNNTPQKRVDAILEYMNNLSKEERKTEVKFYGKISKMDVKSDDGQDVGNYTIEGLNEYEGKELKVGIANENIYANIYNKGSKNEKTLITGPDSISLVPEFQDTNFQIDNNISVLDVTDLVKWYQEGKEINLYVISIEASQKVKDCSNLINIWNNFSKRLGGFGDYPVSS